MRQRYNKIQNVFVTYGTYIIFIGTYVYDILIWNA